MQDDPTIDDKLQQADPKKWLTSNELCRRWNIHRRTLERYRRIGKIETYKFIGMPRFSLAEVIRIEIQKRDKRNEV